MCKTLICFALGVTWHITATLIVRWRTSRLCWGVTAYVKEQCYFNLLYKWYGHGIPADEILLRVALRPCLISNQHAANWSYVIVRLFGVPPIWWVADVLPKMNGPCGAPRRYTARTCAEFYVFQRHSHVVLHVFATLWSILTFMYVVNVILFQAETKFGMRKRLYDILKLFRSFCDGGRELQYGWAIYRSTMFMEPILRIDSC